MKLLFLTAVSFLLATPALAESHASGDVAAGEIAFAKQCVACHVVVNDAGEKLAGRRSKTGPNLFGVAMRPAGVYPEFRYSKSMIAAGAADIQWTEENFASFVANPTEWLREALGDPKARSKMSFKIGKEQDALNIYAYLASLGQSSILDETADTGDTSDALPTIPVSYSSEQSERGEKRYKKDCMECHGDSLKGGLNGGAPLRGVAFEKKYLDGVPASWMFEFMASKMPPNSPGRYSPSVYAELMAYILDRNGFKEGAPLPSDVETLDTLLVQK